MPFSSIEAHKATRSHGGGLDTFTAVSLCESGDHEDPDVLAAWQHLVDTGLAWQLQGWFGRQAASLIEAGVLTP